MSKGLDNRVQREQIRGMRLQNAQAAMQMGRPTAMLEDMGLLQGLGQREDLMRAQEVNQIPGLLEMLNEQMDPSAMAIEYLRKLGLTGDVVPREQEDYGMMEDPADALLREQIMQKIQTGGN